MCDSRTGGDEIAVQLGRLDDTCVLGLTRMPLPRHMDSATGARRPRSHGSPRNSVSTHCTAMSRRAEPMGSLQRDLP